MDDMSFEQFQRHIYALITQLGAESPKHRDFSEAVVLGMVESCLDALVQPPAQSLGSGQWMRATPTMFAIVAADITSRLEFPTKEADTEVQIVSDKDSRLYYEAFDCAHVFGNSIWFLRKARPLDGVYHK